MTTLTHKTSFQKVFRGTQLHYDRLTDLLFQCNQLQLHTTHFSKYYLLNCPPAIQKSLHKDALEVITSELNKLDNTNHRGSGDRRALVDHFLPFISAYKNQINYQGEGVRYFQQLSTYMSETFETNIKDSDLEPGISDQSYLMDELFLLDADRTLIHQIQAFLPRNIHVNGIPRDITTRPEAYLNSYIALGRLFDQYGLRSFNAVPLSTSTVPRYLILDTNILLKQILGITQPTKINEETKPDIGLKAGFDVLLLDEYKTSKECPGCEGETVKTFKRRENPKPWRNNEVTVHGLLRWQSEKCQQSCGHPSRLWNRDDVATLNQRSIVESMLAGEFRPVRFQRANLPE
ncbi:hypothetical protein HK099_003952 [Clydaea vesicula]|uniref:Uncharacterized protein n=1 Tax=Clydaea vesicula TaxID=447962 RepID=A0AAD5U5J6_9FUNG|nr:hypothetical protein HK099_003952 [Clydaea vesicula]